MLLGVQYFQSPIFVFFSKETLSGLDPYFMILFYNVNYNDISWSYEQQFLLQFLVMLRTCTIRVSLHYQVDFRHLHELSTLVLLS